MKKDFIVKIIGPDRGYTIDDKTFVWAIPKQGKILFHAAFLGRKELEKIVTDLREPLDANPTTIGDIPDFDTALAYHLYAELLKPVAEGWKSASDLIVVNSGPLSYGTKESASLSALSRSFAFSMSSIHSIMDSYSRRLRITAFLFSFLLTIYSGFTFSIKLCIYHLPFEGMLEKIK
ncbi:MAG: hypothetical protein Q8N95_12235 [Desulfobacterales bacterium]|nr:hypothetical protein [Desulfobacterales bacterium]